MAIANYFYNQTTRKYVALFGTIFNQLKIERRNNDGSLQQSMVVPLSYAPFQKILARVLEDPDLLNSSRPAISLPRMSFEVTNISYDPVRKVSSTIKMRKEQKLESESSRNFVYSAVPYNLDFSLYIMTKYNEDATQLMEQILPFFTPDWTFSAKMIPDLDAFDIPVVLTSVTQENLYEGDFTSAQTVLYTLTFTLKGYYFGPEKQRKVIKFMDIGYAASTLANAEDDESTEIYPVIVANTAIGWADIEFDDDWDAKVNYNNTNSSNTVFELDIFETNIDLESSNNSVIDLQSGLAIDDLSNT
jgi:hypothetical protein